MSHYVCDECGVVSGNPGTCSTGDCSNKDHGLEECDCSNDEHMSRLSDDEEDIDDEDGDYGDDDGDDDDGDDWEDDDEDDDWN